MAAGDHIRFGDLENTDLVVPQFVESVAWSDAWQKLAWWRAVVCSFPAMLKRLHEDGNVLRFAHTGRSSVRETEE